MQDRPKEKMRDGNKIAVEVFYAGSQKCPSDDELAGFVRMLCTLAAKTIHGMEGQKFKKDFLRGAIADKESITPMRSQ